MNEQTGTSCPQCGMASPTGASFCGNCGSALSVAPPSYPPMTHPQAVSPADSRNWGMAAHLSALAGAMLGGLPAFVGPLVIWVMRRDTDSFAAQHALEALNFNLTTLGIAIVGVILGVVTLGLGFIALFIFLVLWLVWTIQAAMAASRGEPYRYPLSLRLVN